MNYFFRLLNFEFERLSKFLFTLMTITVVSQFAGFLIRSRMYMGEVHHLRRQLNYTTEQILQSEGAFTINTISRSLWTYGPFALCIIGLLFYGFFIWYRDWFGQNTFAYRLLMLPINRMFLFITKLITLFIAIFSLLTLQIGILLVGQPFLSLLVSNEFFQQITIQEIIGSNTFLQLFLPDEGILFFLSYGFGLLFLIVLFTAILIERSYRKRGILYGIIYGILSLFLIIGSITVNYWFPFSFEFYSSEAIKLAAGTGTIIGIFSLVLSNHLINRKLTI